MNVRIGHTIVSMRKEFLVEIWAAKEWEGREKSNGLVPVILNMSTQQLCYKEARYIKPKSM